MKAVILAAGKGSRLKPLTDSLPKVMVPVCGKPVLEHHIENLARAGITEIFVNLHHLPDVITKHCGDGSRWGVHIDYSYEPDILGTAGAIKKLKRLLSGGPFLVLYGDNFLEIDLSKFIGAAEVNAGVGTVAVFEKADVSGSGILELSTDNKVIRFKEKPAPDEVFSHWVNAGLFLFRSGIFDFIPTGFSDFGVDVIPALIRKKGCLSAYKLSGHVWALDDLGLLNELNLHLLNSSGTMGEA
jgi:NDP-sugar pyrophosphorylase family protein